MTVRFSFQVTFRETALLYNSTISSAANKQRVASTVAHELAHMWFGNLVTMAWWNELWFVSIVYLHFVLVSDLE